MYGYGYRPTPPDPLSVLVWTTDPATGKRFTTLKPADKLLATDERVKP
jgi:hypothetical protein